MGKQLKRECEKDRTEASLLYSRGPGIIERIIRGCYDRGMRRYWLPAAGVLALLAIGATTLSLYSHAPKPQPKPAPAAVSQTAPPDPSEISLSGKVEPTKVVAVPPLVEGVIERFMAGVGEDVFEGQVLAHIRSGKLDSAEEAARLDAEHARSRVSDIESKLIAARLEASRSRAEATRIKGDLDRAEKAYLHQQMLNREGATPRLVFEKAEKDYNALKADAGSVEVLANSAEERVTSLTKELQAAQALFEQKNGDLEDAVAELAAGDVHCPADGIVINRRGEVGEQVNRAMPALFEIAVNLSSLQVSVAPDAKALPRIHAGQPASIEIVEAPGGIPGTVREVKQGQVLVDFTSPSPMVRPGLSAQVRIPLN